MSRFDARYFDRAALWRYRAGWAGLTTTRSTPATCRDRGGILRTAAPGVLRLDWQDGRPYALVEPEGENLLAHSADMTQGAWQKVGDGTAEATTIPGPIEGTTAVRVSPDPTSTAGVRQIVPDLAVEGEDYSAGIWLRGEAGDIGRRVALLLRAANMGAGASSVSVTLTGEWVRYPLPRWTGPAGSLGIDLRIRTDTAEAATSVLVGNATVEPGPVLTSDVVTGASPATRDRDLVSVGYHHAPGSHAILEAGREAGLRDQPLGRAWQVGSGVGVTQRVWQLYHHGSGEVMSLRLGSGSAATQSTVPLVPLGAEYLRLALLDVDEVTAQARVRLLQRHREPGGAWVEADGGWSNPLDVGPLLDLGWQSRHLTIGNVREGTRAGRLQLSDMLVLDGCEVSVSALTWDRVREWLP